ncbi:hypothetical protein B0A55_01903 [Friedmanniomyces simplex]|uniref:RBR-type E3 ubiquitin transferase n=1 Tax=Friedmanniomyces simplex TaxID=329884 RepID=A0A4U0XUK8_9PEZI|nr:hypothetical protein B0A55_01903 [Friedmanniomyces simplex]
MADSGVEPCAACYEPTALTSMLQAPCFDYLCTGCLDTIFKLAMTDETFYPPQCCRCPLPIKAALRHLPPATVREYKAKRLELTTVNKTYCHKSACSAFIAPHSIHNGEAFCQECRAKTCSKCKCAAHFGPCTFAEDAELLGIARVEKWQRCPGCRRLVERSEGCPDMECRCGTNFCYTCGRAACDCVIVDDEDGEAGR